MTKKLKLDYLYSENQTGGGLITNLKNIIGGSPVSDGTLMSDMNGDASSTFNGMDIPAPVIDTAAPSMDMSTPSMDMNMSTPSMDTDMSTPSMDMNTDIPTPGGIEQFTSDYQPDIFDSQSSLLPDTQNILDNDVTTEPVIDYNMGSSSDKPSFIENVKNKIESSQIIDKVKKGFEWTYTTLFTYNKIGRAHV
jgi:hypothetical protein